MVMPEKDHKEDSKERQLQSSSISQEIIYGDLWSEKGHTEATKVRLLQSCSISNEIV